MYKKIANLNKIEQLGLNLHNYYVPDTREEFEVLLATLKLCTIRTDSEKMIQDLPFYIVDSAKTTKQEVGFIWDRAVKNGYRLIISDGIKYDSIQEYNLVVQFQKNGDFLFEASELKLPLRHMYRYPLLSCTGNISEEVSTWEVLHNKYSLNRCQLKRDLEELYSYGIYNHWLEVTKYPVKVGKKQEQFVFWQIL